MPNILLVEDENEIREIEKDYLDNAKFTVFEAGNGKKALEIFQREKIDLIVLDLNLPLLDGIEVCKKIREQSGIPIIMVTARTKEIDEILGLEIGADDYLKKPFSPKVLVARVKTLLRRPDSQQGQKRIVVGDLEIDFEKYQIKKKGENVNLTTVQFNILSLMAQNPGKVFRREELIDSSYDDALPPDIFDRTIDSHIKNIRKLIEEDTKKPQYIQTVYGAGYKFMDN